MHTKRLTIIAILLLLTITVGAQSAFTEWKAGTVVSAEGVKAYGIDKCFTSEAISDKVSQRMKGKSYPIGCKIDLASLRYLRILHVNKDGKPQLGEMVCNKSIAAQLLSIFRKLYDAGYRIERMQLIDEFEANDERSMSANNTSCFCYRAINGSSKLSKHSMGLAVDINPLTNPCVHIKGKTAGKVEPANAKAYARNRNIANTKNKQTLPTPQINTSDLCYRLFINEGFIWGGAWNSKKDYQHFEKK